MLCDVLVQENNRKIAIACGTQPLPPRITSKTATNQNGHI